MEKLNRSEKTSVHEDKITRHRKFYSDTSESESSPMGPSGWRISIRLTTHETKVTNLRMFSSAFSACAAIFQSFRT